MDDKARAKIAGLELELLVACALDDVDLASALTTVADETPEERSIDATLDRLLRAVKPLLDAGLVVVGSPRSDATFDVWPGDATENLARVKTTATSIGRLPRIGEIVWFTATRRGLEFAGPVLAERVTHALGGLVELRPRAAEVVAGSVATESATWQVQLRRLGVIP